MVAERLEIPIPGWVLSKGIKVQAPHTQRFLLRLAALYASENGGLETFCGVIGISNVTLLRFISPNKTTAPLDANLAVNIEGLIGRNIITHEQLAPHIFRI